MQEIIKAIEEASIKIKHLIENRQYWKISKRK